MEREKWRRGQLEAMREVKGSGVGGGLEMCWVAVSARVKSKSEASF